MQRAAALPHSPDSERGFTLLEMLAVLAITGLIAGLVYPQIETARLAVRQRLAREQVAAGLEAARATALRSGKPVALSAEAGALVIGGARRIAITYPDTLALQPRIVLFYPDGSTTGGRLMMGQTSLAIARVGAGSGD